MNFSYYRPSALVMTWIANQKMNEKDSFGELIAATFDIGDIVSGRPGIEKLTTGIRTMALLSN